MVRNSLFAAGLSVALAASFAAPTAAQETADAASEGGITLELNRISDTASGGCALVFFGHNKLETGLSEVTWRLAVFGADGVFRNLLALPLGELSSGKRRVVQFNLPTACAELSEIIVNDVASCTLEGDTESDACLSDVTVSSRTDIAFGL